MNCFLVCIAALLATSCAVDGSVIVYKTSPAPQNSVSDASNKTAPTEDTTANTEKSSARRVTVAEVTTAGDEASTEEQNSPPLSVPHQFMRLLMRNEPIVYAPLGSSVELSCLGTSSPPATIKWKFENNFITKEAGYSDQNDIKEVPIGQLMSRYRISCLTAEHVGRYLCIARTGTRVVTSSSVKIVIGNPNITETPASVVSTTMPAITTRVAANAECDATAFTTPRIVIWGPTLLQFMGQDAKLPCEAVGNPKPTVRWLDAEGVPVDVKSKTSRFRQLSTGELIISKLEWSDMGTYVCSAVNKLGNDTAESFVYPTKRSPRFS